MSFVDADLSGIHLENVRCVGCDFRGTDFTEATLKNFEVTAAKFCDASGCALGLTEAHASEMFTYSWSHEALAQHTPTEKIDDQNQDHYLEVEMFQVIDFSEERNGKVVHSVFGGEPPKIRSCRNPELENRADEFLVGEDWAIVTVSDIMAECE